MSIPNPQAAIQILTNLSAAVSKAKEAAETPRTEAGDVSDDEPWLDNEYAVMTKSGKQKSPNMIRNALQKYIDNSGRTSKSVIEELRVSANSFYKFMNPKKYKDAWNATQNETYWAGARLLCKVEILKKREKKTNSKKRTSEDGASDAGGAPAVKKAKKANAKQAKQDAEDWMNKVLQIDLGSPDDSIFIYDSCPIVVKKIKACLSDVDGMNKSSFCRVALRGSNAQSLARFLTSKQQDQAANKVYRLAYIFFEKLRIMKNEPKSAARLKNESELPKGFNTAIQKSTWFYVGADEEMTPKEYAEAMKMKRMYW